MTQRGRGRPPKFPPDEVRARLLDQARTILHESGVDCGLDAVTLDGAIASAGVPRGSAYRLWQDEARTPQDVFREAVVVDILLMPATTGLPATKALIEGEISRHQAVFDRGDRTELDTLIREMIRVVGAFNFEQLDASRNWRIYDAIRTAASTRDFLDDATIKTVREGEEFLIEQYARLYESMAALFRLRIREPYEVQDFASAMYALSTGLAHRHGENIKKRGIMRPTGPDGELQEWTLLSIGFEALVPQFFEPIDD